MAVKPIPDGYHTVTPYLTVTGVAKLIDFLKRAFDAKELHCMTAPDGSVMHGEVRIGDSPVMLGEARGEWPAMPSAFYLYVPDIDALYKRAIAAGGISVREPTNEFYGDRVGGVKDAFGNQWWIATHIEDVGHEEIARRAQGQKK